MVKVLVLSFVPFVLMLVVWLIGYTELQFSVLTYVWFFVSPIWTIIIAAIAYTTGRTIEVIEKVKQVNSLYQDNKHLVSRVGNYIKRNNQ
ncbi:MAG: hypothetical protein ACXW2E_00540 [Nitrososphaeraceae archaeon]